MTRLNVTPTRMNLNTLKKRLATSKRGYKLLKDKQDELMRQFLEKIRENKRLREEVEADLKDSSKGFLMASSFMSPEFLEEAVSFPTQTIGVDIRVKNVMSVRIPQMEFKIDKGGNENASMYPYGLAQTCLLYTSDAADDLLCVDLGGRRNIKKKKKSLSRHMLEKKDTLYTM